MINVRDNCDIPDMLHTKMNRFRSLNFGVGAPLRKFPGGNEAGKMAAFLETSRGLEELLALGSQRGMTPVMPDD
jgi:hypothetical protein